MNEEYRSRRYTKKKKDKSLGSVLFFKRLIAVLIVIMIAVPTFFALYYKYKYDRLAEGKTEKKEAVTLVSADYKEQSTEKSDEEDVRETETAAETSPAELTFEIADLTFSCPAEAAYQELYPDFYAPNEIGANERTDKTAYLTFDDGPSRNTSIVLDILAVHDVKATFYVIGNETENNIKRMQRMIDEGHSLGMHSYSHDCDKIYASVESFLDDMYKVFRFIKDNTGFTPVLFRFPYGSVNEVDADIYEDIMAEMMRRGFVPCDWNVSPEESTEPGLSDSAIANRVVTQAEKTNRAFILLHDYEGSDNMVGALDEIIDELEDRGFTFRAITPETKPVLFGIKK